MTNKGIFLLAALFMSLTAWADFGPGHNDPLLTFDEATLVQADTIPLQDRETDSVNNNNPENPFDLDDPPVIVTEVTYDPESGYYVITEKIGDTNYRPPTYMTFDEYMEWSADNQEMNYQQELSDKASFFDKLTIGGPSASTNLDLDDPVGRYKEAIRSSLINRLFGGADLDPKKMIDIRPQGNIDLTFGVDYQRVENPILTERQRTQGGFDFDMAIQMNVIGKIGDKLNLATNYNTQATFNFDNQMNLEYAGTEDEIIQKIEAGNVSLPLRSSLIQGSQSLFGIKTDLRFGRLSVSAIASQKKSKRENLQVQGGTQLQDFEVTADQYDQNRHFFISHYNRNSYEPALQNLPQINTLFRITKMQVWVTNTRAVTQNARDIVALMDLGETDPTKIGENVAINPGFAPTNPPRFPDLLGNGLPDNRSSGYFDAVKALPGSTTLDGAVAALQSAGLDQSVDFEKVRARLLSPTEYTYHPELGFVSLNLTLQPDEVLGVAYEYTYNGDVFRVGEFTNDSPNLIADTTATNTMDNSDLGVLYVKMLKSAVLDVELPMWDLMMKNIYSIGAYQVNPQDFKLDVFYQDPGVGFIRNLPDRAGPVVSKCNLISLLNLDNLNSQGDPLADGVFDFVPGITITPKNGRIIFPVLEPFGSSMRDKFGVNGNPDGFVYPQLYENTVFFAREFPELNRFVIRGTYKSSVSSRISLGAFNIPRGSVTVTAGGQQLTEGQDYDVDYNTGQVTILNDAYLNSGLPVNVSYEDNTLFGFQTKTLYGTRLDYEVSDNFNIGGTFMHVSERPFTQKVNIGDDPVSNSVYGLDVTYSREAPGLTRFLDKLPLLQTKAPSQISFTAEGAALRPGHSRALNRVDQSEDRGGTVYIDDFEGSSTNYDLRTPATAWLLASTPSSYPEADRINDLSYGYNRAKMTWYRIDPVLRSGNNINDPYVRQFSEQDIFPNRQNSVTGLNNVGLFTFDMAYYPDERGPYNFEATADGEPGISKGIDTNTGKLNDPESRWGGVMRAIQTNDFEAANVEYVEFWMLSPFINSDFNPSEWNAGDGGNLSLNLGTISEDIMRDSRLFFENGLPTPTSQVQTDSTTWSRIPRGQAITNAFDNNQEARAAQDLGLDGIGDLEENDYFAAYVSQMNALGFDVTEDPSNDNYLYHRDVDAYGELDDPNSTPIIERYKSFNNPQGNSLGQGTFTEQQQQQQQNNQNPSSTNIPDTEDINRDNTLNEKEAYFEYDIPLRSDGEGGIQRNGNNFIVDEVELGEDSGVKWYQFRIPVGEFNDKFGNIQDFRSIRFMRMYANEFEQPVIMRFARLQLVRNQWRRYRRPLTGTGIGPITDPNDPTLFEVASVNFEENSNAQPFPYVLPPGIQREQSLGAFPNALQNEQSLAMNICDLEAGDARSVYKIINLDMRRYERLKMFVHAESDNTGDIDELEPGELSIFMRLGSDFEDNFYEYEIPLLPSEEVFDTDDLNAQVEKVWREENRFDFPLALFRETKKARNASGEPVTTIYTNPDPDKPDNIVRIVGNPDLGYVKGVMIGLRNTTDATNICAEVWVNELRLSGLDERGGVAGLARLDVQLADFGSVTASASHTGIGWGQLEQRVNDRAKESVTQYDIATNLELGKLLPEKSGIRIPFYAQHSTTVETPEFDPYQLDLRLKEDVLDNLETQEERDAVRDLAVDYTSITGFNFTNVRKERMNRERKPMPWDVSNLSLTYAYDRTLRHDPTIENEEVKRYRGSVDYNYASQLRPIAPFKNMKNKSPWLGLIRDFNFNPIPNSINVRNDMNRHHGQIKYRFADELKSTYYDKRFTWDRAYGLQWNLSKGLTMGFNAVNSSVIDEIEEYTYNENGFPEVDPTTGNPLRPTDEAKKEQIQNGLRTGGRNKHYNHGLNISYTLPTKQIPLLAWTSIKAQYQSNYDWSRASLNTDSLGNVIQNGQTRSITGDLDLTKLYNESDYLKKINSKKRKTRKKKEDPRKVEPAGKDDPAKPKGKQDIKFKDPTLVEEVVEEVVDDIIEGDKGKGKKNKKKRREAKKKGIDGADDGSLGKGKDKKDREPSAAERAILRTLMMIRKARVSYSEDFSSVVPGFVPETRLLGQNDAFNSPGWDYVFGANYGLNWRLSDFTSWLDDRGASGDIIGNRFLNRQVLVNYTKTYDGKLTIEPFNDFRIDVNVNRSFSKNHSQYYKVQDIGGELEHLNELDRGSLNMTYFTIRTLFGSTTEELIDKFDIFENNRVIISDRLAALDVRSQGDHEIDTDFGDYREGYGRYQQDVLVPAFLSAYTGKDAATFPLTVFDVLPRPNWKFTYNGLNKLEAFKNIFSSFNLSHGYSSTLSINSFATDLDFQNYLYNDVTRNFFSTYEIPDLVISERFSPLIGIDIRTKNDMLLRFDWNKSRNLAMSFTDYQLSETNSEEFTVGVGYRVKGFKLPFKLITIPGTKGEKTNVMENDLNFKLDVSYRDDVTINHLLDQEQTVPTRGSKVIRISPSIDYAVNKFVNVRIFFDRSRTIPKTSASFPITNTQGGVTIRFSLTQ